MIMAVRSHIEHSIETRGPGLKSLVCFVRILIAIGLLVLLLVLSESGGVLNRGRGGFVSLSSLSNYWLEYDLHRELFSLVTGVLVFFACGFHIRAGIMVWLLTQFSLYINWSPYASVGTVDTNYNSPSGIFDWVIGRQEMGWNYTQRFVREYSGISLCGLIWTLPQGYLLQYLGFGWQYSLSGSLMAVIYYAGSRTHGYNDDKFFQTPIGFSEYIWGTCVWFIILISASTQLIYRIRCWVYSKSTSSITSPYTRIDQLLYHSLNYTITDILYNLLLVLFWAVFTVSVLFYAMVSQSDSKNKAQTFFGLFFSVLSFTFLISWRWSYAYNEWAAHRAKEKQVAMATGRPAGPSRINDIDRLEGGGGRSGESDPLLPWPYSHPDKGDRRISPVATYDSSRSSTPIAYSPVPFPLRGTSVIRSGASNRPHPYRSRRPMSRVSLAFVLIWPLIEKWVWLDLFAICRHVIGILALVATFVAMTTTSLAFAWNLNVPRYDSTCNITCYT